MRELNSERRAMRSVIYSSDRDIIPQQKKIKMSSLHAVLHRCLFLQILLVQK